MIPIERVPIQTHSSYIRIFDIINSLVFYDFRLRLGHFLIVYSINRNYLAFLPKLRHFKVDFSQKGFIGKVDEKSERAAILKTFLRQSYLHCFIGL